MVVDISRSPFDGCDVVLAELEVRGAEDRVDLIELCLLHGLPPRCSRHLPPSNTIGLVHPTGTHEKHVHSILVKLRLSETEDDRRRVLAVVAYLDAR
jgi:hypothetical protein